MDESQRQKWVNLSFIAAGGLVAYIVFALTFKIAGIYDLEARIPQIDLVIRGFSILAGGILFFYLYKRDQTQQFMHEVIVELSRVTWPTRVDTSRATVVCLIMVLIAGMILGGLDSLWTWALQLIL